MNMKFTDQPKQNKIIVSYSIFKPMKVHISCNNKKEGEKLWDEWANLKSAIIKTHSYEEIFTDDEKKECCGLQIHYYELIKKTETISYKGSTAENVKNNWNSQLKARAAEMNIVD